MSATAQSHKKRRPRELLTSWPTGSPVAGATFRERSEVLPLAAVMSAASDRIDHFKLSKPALAAKVGISRSSLNRFLNGEAWPSFEHVTNLAQVLLLPELLQVAQEAIPTPE